MRVWPACRSAVDAGRVTRFAIANPQHAPYGRAAREVLERLGLWQRLQPAMVLGENASQAMQFAASGSCQGGIVPLSLASAPDIAKLGTFEAHPGGLAFGAAAAHGARALARDPWPRPSTTTCSGTPA